MNIKYNEFKEELENRIESLCSWLKSIEHGYVEEVDEDEFCVMKTHYVSELGLLMDDLKDEFGEYLED